MDGNPMALVDVWGASADGGEKGGAQKHADNYKAETGRSYSNDPSDGYVFDGVDVSAPAATAYTPTTFAFANDATFVSQGIMENIQGYQQMQTAVEYDQNVSFLQKVGAFFRRLDRGGRGDYTNWNVSDAWQLYNPDGGGFGAAINGRGNPRLVDVNTIPFRLGLMGGFGSNRRIGYIGGKDSKSWVLFGKDVSKICQFGLKTISGANQFTAATESVVGKGDGGSKPVTKIANGKTVVTHMDNKEMKISTVTPGTSNYADMDSVVSTKGVVDSLFILNDDGQVRQLWIKKEGDGDYNFVKSYY